MVSIIQNGFLKKLLNEINNIEKNNMKPEIDFEKFESSLLDTSKLTEDHIVAIGINSKGLSTEKAQRFAEAVSEAAKKAFHPAKTAIYHQGSTEFKIINKGEIE